MTCQCPLSATPFLCPRHKVEMSPEYHTICRGEPLVIHGNNVPYNQADYFNLWSGMAAAGAKNFEELQAASMPDAETDPVTHACVHLGPAIGLEPCTCGGAADKRALVYACPYKGRTMAGATPRIPVSQGGPAACRGCDLYEKSTGKFKTEDGRKVVDRKPCRLTFGMAVGAGEEFSAIWATINNILMHDKQIFDDLNAEVLVVNCGGDPKFIDSTKRWTTTKPRIGSVPRGRFIQWQGPDGSSQPRNAVFDYALGDVVICVDPHVMLAQGAIKAIVDWLADHPLDMVSGPLEDDNGKLSWFQRPKWAAGALGLWADNLGRLSGPFKDWQVEVQGDRSKPFEIWQQGMGLFACRREAWPGFHRDARGWGGCETFAASSIRARGGKVICHPDARWRHRFQRPFKVEWTATKEQQLRNYLIGFHSLGLQVEFDTCLLHYLGLKDKKTGQNILKPEQVNRIASEVFATYGPPSWLTKSSDQLTPWQLQLLEDTHSGAAIASEVRSSASDSDTET